jgi:hypothetical protein
LNHVFGDLISEKEVAEFAIQSTEDPVEGDESDEDSDSEDGENQEEAKVIVPTLRMQKRYGIGNWSVAIAEYESRIRTTGDRKHNDVFPV